MSILLLLRVIQWTDAQMKSCCMCVSSFMCSECRRSVCRASLLMWNKVALKALTTRRDHTVFYQTSCTVSGQEKKKASSTAEHMCVFACVPFTGSVSYQIILYCRSGSCMQCVIFSKWGTLTFEHGPSSKGPFNIHTGCLTWEQLMKQIWFMFGSPDDSP